MKQIHKNILLAIIVSLLLFVFMAATVNVNPDGTVTIGSITVATDGAVTITGRVKASSYEGFGVVPVGTIIAWHGSMSGTPGLPDGWVSCDGLVVNDPASPYNGQATPNLNFPRNAWNEGGSFLRGSSSSGIWQNDALKIHNHNHQYSSFSGGGDGINGNGVKHRPTVITSHNAGDANESRPVNMSVIWVMRIK